MSRRVAAVLAQHQKVSMGMTYGSPDTCRCGADVYPDRGDTEVTLRRDVAFAAHQADALTDYLTARTPWPRPEDRTGLEWADKHDERL